MKESKILKETYSQIIENYKMGNAYKEKMVLLMVELEEQCKFLDDWFNQKLHKYNQMQRNTISVTLESALSVLQNGASQLISFYLFWTCSESLNLDLIYFQIHFLCFILF